MKMRYAWQSVMKCNTYCQGIQSPFDVVRFLTLRFPFWVRLSTTLDGGIPHITIGIRPFLYLICVTPTPQWIASMLVLQTFNDVRRPSTSTSRRINSITTLVLSSCIDRRRSLNRSIAWWRSSKVFISNGTTKYASHACQNLYAAQETRFWKYKASPLKRSGIAMAPECGLPVKPQSQWPFTASLISN